ncbi:class I SAM-dependent methyltransferase [Sphingomonas piscis]|uniref:Class I SAM-dependent methyltransferase n=1 Tax=Sphingomonas piscis TaxID=2714943 RepID=A0A6G7YSF3_9SPHN|nr:class I SAM-dependent methyltransferase [Sphingomonas piscis]QIK79664.1 class I SAM-dependent methyltransferase [Sphingomonas piscis]
MALALRAINPAGSELPVYHFAPEKGVGSVLQEMFGASYTPADLSPENYDWSEVPVKRIDLSRSTEFLPTRGARGLVHSHVLEHVPGDLTSILLAMNAAVEVGGFHAFVVPFFSEWYREDMDPNVTYEERDRLYGQFDHLRSFGTRDFLQRIHLAFSNFEKVDLTSIISFDDCQRSGIPVTALTRLTSHSVHFYWKTHH